MLPDPLPVYAIDATRRDAPVVSIEEVVPPEDPDTYVELPAVIAILF